MSRRFSTVTILATPPNNSSRARFAARLNSGVRPHANLMGHSMKDALTLLALLAAVVSFDATAQIGPLDRHEALRRSSDTFSRENLTETDSRVRSDRRSKCMAVAAIPRLCDCLAKDLPGGLSFDQYVVVVTRSKEENGYSKLSPSQKKTYDAIPAVRDACAAPGSAS